MASSEPEIDMTEVEAALSKLSLTSSTSQTSTAIATLANASKQSVTTRQRLATSETLKALIDYIESHLSTDLETVDLALRCIANACADNTEARDSISSLGFSWAVQCFAIKNDDVSLLTTKVLYNICSDHETSQRKGFEEKVYIPLIEFLAGDYARNHGAEMSFAIDVLFWMVGMKASAGGNTNEPLSDELLVDLLLLPCVHANNVDLETFASLSETVLAFLRDAKEQEHVVANEQLDDIFRILHTQQLKASSLDTSNSEEAEDLKVLLALSTSFVWILSDIAALPAFSKTYNLEHEQVKTRLVGQIKALAEHPEQSNDPDGLLLTAYCQVLGNLLWSLPEGGSGSLVEREQLHRSLLAIILAAGDRKEDAGVLHSAAGLLIQLTRPSMAVREIIGGEESARPALERLVRHEMPNVKQEGVRLLRTLGQECPANQQRFAELAKEALLASAQSSDARLVEEAPS